MLTSLYKLLHSDSNLTLHKLLPLDNNLTLHKLLLSDNYLVLHSFTFANSVDPNQVAIQEANWSRSTLSSSMWICINNLDQVIWLAENETLVWHQIAKVNL